MFFECWKNQLNFKVTRDESVKSSVRNSIPSLWRFFRDAKEYFFGKNTLGSMYSHRFKAYFVIGTLARENLNFSW
jgi:hypothetical protein